MVLGNVAIFLFAVLELGEIGNPKEVELRQKELMKKYIPLKKQLCKLLKVELIDICDLKAYESEFATQEFNAIDTENFDE